MAVRTRIKPIEREVRAMVAAHLSPEAQKRHAADFARKIIGEAIEVNTRTLGHAPNYETFVDGRKGAPFETVNVNGGKIVAVFDVVNSLLDWITNQLRTHSPVKSGRYADSNKLFADGVEVVPGAGYPPALEYVFLNVQPYARKVEKGESNQAANGVYQAVSVLAKQRFGATAKIKFVYREPFGAEVNVWAAASAKRRGTKGRGSTHKRAAYLSRQPAIIVTVR
jgi:hypothetical protein